MTTRSETRYHLIVAGPLSQTATELIAARFGAAATISSNGTDSTIELVADQPALRSLLTLLWDLGNDLVAVSPVSASSSPALRGRPPGRRLSRSLRWPATATCLALSLILAGFVLDRWPGQGRDLALVIGGPALTVLLPVSVCWLIVVFVLRHRGERNPEPRDR